jgi:hypothetical protein
MVLIYLLLLSSTIRYRFIELLFVLNEIFSIEILSTARGIDDIFPLLYKYAIALNI